MIGKLLLGRVVPLGAAALLLKSSYSPIQPALAAFSAAANALAGGSAQDSGAHFDQAAQDMQAGIQQAQGGGLKAALENLFGGGSHPDQAQKQLDAIIQHVKSRGGDLPPAPTPAAPHDHHTAGQPAKRKGAGKAPSRKK